MPVLEGLSLAPEKAAVVLDFGQAYTKCGFAGENCPRFIIPSSVERLVTGQVVGLWETAPKDMYSVLLDFIHKIYFKLLLVSPRERRVVICESFICPHYFRQALASVFFKHYEAPSMFFGISHQLCLYTLALPTALVIDVGFRETTVLPIMEGIPVVAAWQAVPQAGEALHSHLNSLLMEGGLLVDGQEVKSPQTLRAGLSSTTLEDIKVRTCFFGEHISSVDSAQEGKPSENIDEEVVTGSARPEPLPVNYPLPGNRILLIDGHSRSHAGDVLFLPDNDKNSLVYAVLDALVLCPVDCRKPLAENIILAGGTCQLPGFRHRLLQELKACVKSRRYSEKLSLTEFKLHPTLVPENTVAWLGGAIYGAAGVLKDRSVSRENYMEREQLPDWTSCDPEMSAVDALTPQKKRTLFKTQVSSHR